MDKSHTVMLDGYIIDIDFISYSTIEYRFAHSQPEFLIYFKVNDSKPIRLSHLCYKKLLEHIKKEKIVTDISPGEYEEMDEKFKRNIDKY